MNLATWFSSRTKFVKYARRVSSECGKGMLAQFLELAILRFSRNQVGAQEYYEFEAFDDKKYSLREKRQFVGWRMEGEYAGRLNARAWDVVTTDKLVAYAIFRGLGLPYPRILAVYQPYGRTFPGAITIREENELARYLRDGIDFPFFSKPAHGSSGRNSVACVAYDAVSDELVLANGEKAGVDDYVARCYPRRGVFPWEAGFIFQELVRPAPECERAFGTMVPGMRLVVLNRDAKPQLFRAILKIPTGKSMTDNFGAVGERGTIVAELDRQSGVIVRAQQGIAPDMVCLEYHPITGHRLLGFQIPNWERCLSLLDCAVRAFPGVRLQHWDIAVSDVGPVIFEMNTSGGFGLPQIATRRGFCDDEFVGFIDELGGRYPQYRASDEH